ncbi:MAG: porin family protein [Ignavibacteria bacterium]|nr:porin family protein [Ignavibacteria bacterium]
MKTKHFLSLLIILQIILTSTSISQDKLTYGLKAGMGFWRLMNLKSDPTSYSYPVGFSMGIYVEDSLSKDISLVADLLYQNINSKVTIYTAVEGMLDQEIRTQSLSLPVLIKYKTAWLWNTYFIMGPSFTYLIKSNYKYADHVYGYIGDVGITNNFPSISTSIKFGLGKEILLAGNYLLFELDAQFGITKFKHTHSETDYHEIGSFRNSGIEFNIGVQL